MGVNPYLKDQTERTNENAAPAQGVENTDTEGKTAPVRKKKGKAVKIAVASALAVVLFAGGALTTWCMLDPEMRSLIKLKYKIQKEYYEEITDEEFYGTLFDAVNEGLLDDYSWYMTSDEYAEARSEGQGNQSGIGLVFDTQAADGSAQLLVSRVCGNSPAESAGILEGDHILGFGLTETTVEDNVIFADLSAFVTARSAGERFYLKVLSDGETKTVPITKENYVENYVFYRTNTKSYRFTGDDAETLTERGQTLTCLNDDTAYIRLTQFNGAAAEEFETAMELFKSEGKKSLVLDLRSNGGGYLDIMQDIARYFGKNSDERKPVAVVADYGEYSEVFKADGNDYGDYFSSDSRICVLADSGTASASECLIGYMLDYGAISYGDICLSEREGVSKTYGKGIMQTTYPLKLINADAVKLTTAKIYWPVSGNCIHGRGILPEDGALTVAEDTARDGEIAAAVAKLFG